MSPLNIPNVAHCFWYSEYGLPYLRYISIASFAILNPDFKLKLYTMSGLKTGKAFKTHEQSVVHITKDYTELISTLPNVECLEVPIEFIKSVPFELKTAVHVSDVLRIWLLSKEGGYWIDSDIIFTIPLGNSFLALPENLVCDTIVSQTSFGSICPYLSHRIGFLAASAENELFKSLMDQISNQFVSEDYQAYGAALYNSTYPDPKSLTNKNQMLNILNLPNHALYSLHLTELLSNRVPVSMFINNPHILGCHWYGGGDQLTALVNKLNNVSDVDTALSQLKDNEPSILISLFDFARKLIV